MGTYYKLVDIYVCTKCIQHETAWFKFGVCCIHVWDYLCSFKVATDGFRPIETIILQCLRFCYPTPSPVVMAPKDVMTNSHAKSILNAMNALRKSNTLCDITLRVEGTDFPAHRIVLAACSDYFCAMFTSEVTNKFICTLTWFC